MLLAWVIVSVNKLKFFLIFLFSSIACYFANTLLLKYEGTKQNQPGIEKSEVIEYFLNAQFDFWKKNKISKDALDKAFNSINPNTSPVIYRIQIIKNQIYHSINVPYKAKEVGLLKFLKKISLKHELPDIDLLFCAEDDYPFDEDPVRSELFSKVPLLVMNNSPKYKGNFILIPDSYLIDDHWATLFSKIISANNKYKNSWISKDEKIFWRGSTTGGIYNTDNFHKLARLRLVVLSSLYPDKVDAKFSNLVQFSNDTKGQNLRYIIEYMSLLDDYVTETKHLKYKYLISVDGNVTAWKRVPFILLSNSVLIKQETGNIQWFYPAIKPYVHYIPLQNDLSDIFEKLAWLKKNDSKAKSIAENATDFAIKNLAPEKIEAQFVQVLRNYADIQAFKPTIDSKLYSYDE